MTQVDLWTLEAELCTPDTQPLCGVDEAGRGPLAGPVCAAAVMLPPGLVIPGLNDSKKLSEKKREALYDTIRAQALSYGIAFATVEEIEEYNILGATFLAMNRAIAQLTPQPGLALIDGNRSTGITVPSRCVVGGDGKCADIAPCSRRSRVTAICAAWRRLTRSTALKSTRVTARRRITPPSGNMGRAPSTGRRS